MKPYILCLGNISQDVTANIDYNVIDKSNIIIIHKYLMKKHDTN